MIFVINMEEIKVPPLGIDNRPKVRHKKKKKNRPQEFTYPTSNTGNFTTWERYPIGASKKEPKPDPKKIVKEYLESKMSEFPENKSYPFLSDLGLAD